MTPTEIGVRLCELAVEALALLSDPGNRTHWIALLSALCIALGLAAWQARGVGPSLREWAGKAVSRLRAPAGRVDLGHVVIRPIVSAVLITPWIATALAVALATARGLRRILGSAPELALSQGTVAVLFTLVLFVAWDFSRFAVHWAMHRSDLLWQFHQVHHGAETLNPFTLYRVHPVERILYRLRGVLVTGMLTGAFYYAFGEAVQWQLLGVNALGLAFNVLGGNLRHSHVRWGWGPLERLFVSPAQHQMHHERGAEGDAAGPQTNYGTWLAIWDRALGSWRASAGHEIGDFGLPQAELNHDPRRLLSSLFDPVVAAGQVGASAIASAGSQSRRGAPGSAAGPATRACASPVGRPWGRRPPGRGI